MQTQQSGVFLGGAMGPKESGPFGLKKATSPPSACPFGGYRGPFGRFGGA